jgi:uroporphyrinogen III methyltransferase/synthase
MTVFLVGAGPGDPGLLTVRAAELLRAADVVLADRLVGAEILTLVRPDAEIVYVGKSPGSHCATQESINELLVSYGLSGRPVVRLKGGDPFVFGRGGEEALALAAAGVPFEVVPGISSAVAVPAYAGIPVTHRGLAANVSVVSGHSDVDWSAVGDTVVVLMGAQNLPKIAAGLLEAGRPGTTPVAVIRWGTTPAQQVQTATLDTVGSLSVQSPSVVVVGEVVSLRSSLAWWEGKPLSGLRVLVPRTRAGVSALAARLAALGAVPIEVPTVTVELPADLSALRARADWIAFLSVASVRAVLAAGDVRRLGGTLIAATGDGTVEALRAAGIEPDLVPSGYGSARSLGSVFPAGSGTVMVPAAEVDPAGLSSVLASKGWNVLTPVAGVVARPPLAEHVAHALASGDVHAVAFASSTCVRNLVEMTGPLPSSVLVVAMGRRTATACAEAGLRVDAVPDVASVEGLAQALASIA